MTPTTTSQRGAGASPGTKRASRTTAPRVGLSIDLIVDTACALIAESHTDELTMRRLSERLGVALGATYHHVPNRAALLVLVAERINRKVAMPSTNPRQWKSTLRTVVNEFSDEYARYPGMSAFSATNMAATGPAAIRDRLIAVLEAAGFEHESALDVLAAFFFYVSTATLTGVLQREQPVYSVTELRRRFDNGIELLLDGADVRLRADRAARRAAR